MSLLPINKQNPLGCQKLFHSQCVPFHPCSGGDTSAPAICPVPQELSLWFLASSCLRASQPSPALPCCSASFLPPSISDPAFLPCWLLAQLFGTVSLHFRRPNPVAPSPAPLSRSVSAPSSSQAVTSLFPPYVGCVSLAGYLYELHKIPVQSGAGWGDPDAQEEMFHISRSAVCAPRQPLPPAYQM